MGFHPEKIRVVDLTVVAELRKLVALRSGSGEAAVGGEVVGEEVVVVDELKNVVKAGDLEVQHLKEREA
ncbi:hypothetical protein SESBI_19479 [Sesbania bispinosa]|nr:hypothetical protein SESBI_19479 [Sesbania bispinosa]